LLNNEMGKLDKGHNSVPYQRIKTKIEEIRGDPRYQFMFSGMLVGDTMAEFVGRVFRLPSHGKPISIIDVSGVPSEITSTVVAVLSRLVFDYAIWSRDEETRRSCWSAKKRTVTCLPRRTPTGLRWAASFRASPRKAANTAFRWA